MTLQPLLVTCAIALLSVFPACETAAGSTILGTAENAAILGSSTITNTGATTIYGDMDLYPGTSITGQATISLNGTVHDTDAVAQQAQIDATSAYNILAGLSSTENLSGTDLGGLTLTPGVYTFNSSAALDGELLLNFNGASNEDIVFQIASTLTTGATASASVVVENGNSTDGVFFEVGSSATLGAGTLFAGNILALDSITFDSAAEILCGRAIALTAAVTMIGNTVSNNCFGAGGEGSGISDFTSVGYSGGDFTNLGYSGGGFNGVPPGQQGSSAPEPSTLAFFGCGVVGLLGLTAGRHWLRLIPASPPD